MNRSLSGALLALLVTVAACSADATGADAPITPAADLQAITSAAVPLTGAAADYDPLLALTAQARFALLGEQTHGTHEFYRERLRITRRLVDEQAFTAVAIEGDWPEAERVNAYVRGQGADATPEAALGDLHGFPRWMWANTDVRGLVQELRGHNQAVAPQAQVGFYGLDLQAMIPSADAVVRYLERTDASAAARARQRYACFDAYRGVSAGQYGADAAGDSARSCRAPAAAQLAEMEQRYAAAPATSPAALDSLFSALINALAVERGEAYYSAFGPGESSWNIRDRHMANVLDRMVAHGARLGRTVKVVVWAHNTHVGDYRATGFASHGEVNLAMLLRQQHPGEVVLTGFSTYRGSVFAAPVWGAAGSAVSLPPAAIESHSDVFHRARPGDFLLVLRGQPALAGLFSRFRSERAVGVVFQPLQERESNYYQARLADQFDAMIHIDATSAVTPL